MPIVENITISPNTDCVIQCQISPPTPVGSWSAEFVVKNRFFGISGLIQGSTASGYSNYVSGMSVINSGNGLLAARITQPQISGWSPGAYVYEFARTGSGVNSLLSCGNLNITVN